jgi:hypothetical protein
MTDPALMPGRSALSTAILDGLAIVADRLGIDRAGKTLETLGLEVRHRLETDGDRCLIVFDNATDPDELRPYPPAARQTGRRQLPGDFGAPASRGPPAPAPSYQF